VQICHCKATHTGQRPTFIVVVHVKYMRNRNMFQRRVAVLKHTYTFPCAFCVILQFLVKSRTKNQLSNLQFWFLYYPDTSRNYMHQSTVRYLRMYADSVYRTSSESMWQFLEIKYADRMAMIHPSYEVFVKSELNSALHDPVKCLWLSSNMDSIFNWVSRVFLNFIQPFK
jgi:hypothetical protein